MFVEVMGFRRWYLLVNWRERTGFGSVVRIIELMEDGGVTNEVVGWNRVIKKILHRGITNDLVMDDVIVAAAELVIDILKYVYIDYSL